MFAASHELVIWIGGLELGVLFVFLPQIFENLGFLTIRFLRAF